LALLLNELLDGLLLLMRAKIILIVDSVDKRGSEVNESHLSTLLVEQDILKFDISVIDSSCMQLVDCLDKAPEQGSRLFFSKWSWQLADNRPKVTFALLHEDIQLAAVLKGSVAMRDNVALPHNVQDSELSGAFFERRSGVQVSFDSNGSSVGDIDAFDDLGVSSFVDDRRSVNVEVAVADDRALSGVRKRSLLERSRFSGVYLYRHDGDDKR
jgi:hypothetical protein